MKLLELNTKEEYDAVTKSFAQGGVLIHNHYLGAQLNDFGEWKWIYGGKFSHKIEMSYYTQDNGNCAVYFSLESKYYIVPCSDTVNQVICEKEEGSSNESESSEETAEFYTIKATENMTELYTNTTEEIPNFEFRTFRVETENLTIFLIMLLGVLIFAIVMQILFCCL